MPDLACPHYLNAPLGNPQVVCPGCGSLIADHRHPTNQALGFTAPTTVRRPEVRAQTRKTEARA